jgi:hypothetical protein
VVGVTQGSGFTDSTWALFAPQLGALVRGQHEVLSR